jgi:hypothetical protein
MVPKSSSMGWVAHEARRREKRMHINFGWKPQRTKPLGTFRHTWENSIKMGAEVCIVEGSRQVNGKCNRPWRPIGLWDVEAPTFSRQSAHRWR